MELPFTQRLFYFFPVFFCFCLPFGSLLLSGIVVLWTITAVFNLEKSYLRQGFRRPLLWILYAFFLLTLISAVFSENFSEAVFAVEIKLSFILFPFLLFCFRYPADIFKRCIVAFVSGCFFSCLYLIVRALIYALSGHPEYFFYTLFSDFIHASYFAMYLVLAIVFVVIFYRQWFRTQPAVIYSSWFFIGFFITGIFLCSSKMGLIAFFVCMPLLLFYRYVKTLRLSRLIMFMAGAGVLVWLALLFFPSSFARMDSIKNLSIDNIDKNSVESTAVRVLIWQQALELAKEHWLAGTGVGDANVALYKAYEQNGLSGAYSHRLNAHNQFLQTMVGMGVIGLLPLMVLTLGSMARAIKTRHFLLFVFSLLVSLHFLVESMLQTSAGVLFFVFFLCFFDLVGEERLKADPGLA